MTAIPIIKQDILNQVSSFQDKQNIEEPSWLTKLKESSLQKALKLDVPHPKLERWKNLDAKAMWKNHFPPMAEKSDAPINADKIKELLLPIDVKNLLVLYNGEFLKELSLIEEINEVIIVKSLTDAIKDHTFLVRQRLTEWEEKNGQFENALNGAMLKKGYFIFIPMDQQIKDPIYILNITEGEQQSSASNFSRNLLTMGRNSQAEIIEHFVSLNETPMMNNLITDTFLEPGSCLNYYKIQDENFSNYHLATNHFAQYAESDLNCYFLDLGSDLAKQDTVVTMKEQGAKCQLNTLTISTKSRQLDHRLTVEHFGPNTTSRELMKGILFDKSKIVNEGEIVINEEGTKTDAGLSNRQLVLSDQATAHASPKLDISTDDVMCSHGVTIGPLPKEILFYLKSRGMSREIAEKLLQESFAFEVIDQIKEPTLHQIMKNLISTKIKEGA